MMTTNCAKEDALQTCLAATGTYTTQHCGSSLRRVDEILPSHTWLMVRDDVLARVRFGNDGWSILLLKFMGCQQDWPISSGVEGVLRTIPHLIHSDCLESWSKTTRATAQYAAKLNRRSRHVLVRPRRCSHIRMKTLVLLMALLWSYVLYRSTSLASIASYVDSSRLTPSELARLPCASRRSVSVEVHVLSIRRRSPARNQVRSSMALA